MDTVGYYHPDQGFHLIVNTMGTAYILPQATSRAIALYIRQERKEYLFWSPEQWDALPEGMAYYVRAYSGTAPLANEPSLWTFWLKRAEQWDATWWEHADSMKGACHLEYRFCKGPGREDTCCNPHETFWCFITNKDKMLAYYEEVGKAKLKNPVTGFVYLLKADNGVYKIGASTTPNQRSKTLGLQLPYETALMHTIETDDMYGLENELHRKFAKKRKRGEWFELDEADIEYIKGLGA